MQVFQNPYTALIILGIVAIILEVILGAVFGFELLILGILLIIGGVVEMLSGSMMLAIVTIIVLIIVYIFFARQAIKQALHITTTKTNTDSIMGKTAVVVADITSGAPGQVKIDGEVWRAESEKNISKGKKVTIHSVSGVTVKVTEIKE